MLKHAADRPAVLIAFLVTAVDFALYFSSASFWVLASYLFLMLTVKGTLGAWNHHHQHNFMFRSPFMNRILEICFALQSGTGPFLWVLHHNFGHHVNFLDQEKDESRWKTRSGKRMGVLAYTLSVTLTAYPRAFAVGKRYPELRRQFVFYNLVVLVLVASLVWFKPMAGLMLFVVPMISGLLFVSWVTFDHHSGLYTTNEFEASHNIMHGWYNAVTGNLGHHTAHHHRPGMHWSKLPALHAKIQHKIPEHCYRRSSFEVFVPPDDSELTLGLQKRVANEGS